MSQPFKTLSPSSLRVPEFDYFPPLTDCPAVANSSSSGSSGSSVSTVCPLYLPPLGVVPYGDQATANEIITLLVADCMTFMDTQAIPNSMSSVLTGNSLAQAVDVSANVNGFWSSVYLVAGSTLSMGFSGVSNTDGTGDYTYRFKVYDSLWNELFSNVQVIPGADPTAQDYVVLESGCYYVFGEVGIENATQIAATFTISSTDTMIPGNAIALWDDGVGNSGSVVCV